MTTLRPSLQGQKTKQTKPEPTDAEKLFKRNSRLWLIGAGAALLAYVLLSGQYIKVVQDLQAMDLGDEDDGDEDEGDDDE